jgi:lipoate-protein ligase A
MGETWRLLSDLSLPTEQIGKEQRADASVVSEAAWNMAVDEAIVMAYRKGDVLPTLRLYAWPEPALTIGYFQEISEELDWGACQNHKVSVVRRITGGRAVLHGRDLTYSVVAGSRSSLFSRKDLRQTFYVISRAFLRALEDLGLKAESVTSGVRPSGNTRSPLCFASSSWYEITCENRKVIGSAQRRWPGAFLQQGSVLLEFDPEGFYRLFRFKTENQRLERIQAAKTKVAGLNDLAPEPSPYRKVEGAVIAGFEEALGVTFKEEGLSPQEAESAHRLVLEKYALDAWNLKRVTPSSSRPG